jgi:hypothetical protein
LKKADLKYLRRHKQRVINYHKARKRKYDFCRRRLKKILALSTAGWPRMTKNPDYLKWLDLVYEAKEKGLFSLKTSNCDVIANLSRKANELKKLKQ